MSAKETKGLELGGIENPQPGAGSSKETFEIDLIAEEDSSGSGHARFKWLGAGKGGGQGQIHRVQGANGEESLALKLFDDFNQAKNEWTLLKLHADDGTVPEPKWFGLVVSAPSATGRQSGWAIVMEYIEGSSLQEMIDAGAASEDKRLSVKEALEIIRPIIRFSSNRAGSRHPYPHRDIKPSNIIVERQGSALKARLVDFGIGSTANAPISEADGYMGTKGYAAPELWLASLRRHSDINDLRLDTYSIGATLYAMLVGGEPPEYSKQITWAPFKHNDELTDDLNARLDTDLRNKYMSAGIGNIERAIAKSFDLMDERIRKAAERCLNPNQVDRPMPDKLESFIPMDPTLYAEMLYQNALILCLTPNATDSSFSMDEEKIVDQGFLDALDYFNKGLYNRALPVLQYLAERGQTSAMYYFGVCIRDNLGDVSKFTKGHVAAYFQQASEAGNILAQNAYGLMLWKGEGVPQNKKAGLELIRSSAEDIDEIGKTGFPVAKKWLKENAVEIASLEQKS